MKEKRLNRMNKFIRYADAFAYRIRKHHSEMESPAPIEQQVDGLWFYSCQKLARGLLNEEIEIAWDMLPKQLQSAILKQLNVTKGRET